MEDELAVKLIKRQEWLDSQRSTWEQEWRDIAQRVLPRQDDFIGQRTRGEKRTEHIFDSTAPLALDRFSAAIESMLCPRAQRWHTLRTTDRSLNLIPDVQLWFEEATRILFERRYAPKANFAGQMHEVFMSLGAFGTGCIYVTQLPGYGLRYKSIFLGELFLSEDASGLIDTVYRRYKQTARQVAQEVEAGRYDMMPEKVRHALEGDKPEREFEFLHAVYPNNEQKIGDIGPDGMPIAEVYVCVDTKETLRKSGYRRMPYSVSRYVTSPTEIYGRSPASLVLSDIRMLNEMSKTTIRAAHKVVDPPLLLHDDGVLGQLKTTPNAINYGGVDNNGRQLVHPLSTGARVDIGLEMMDQRRRTINDSFLVNLFQILVETPEMTATEVLERAREKGALLSPAVGRQQTELLGPMIDRELQILMSTGTLPEMPPELIEAQGEYEIEYDSPLTRAQKAEEGVGFLRTLEAAGSMAQFDPTVLEVFDAEKALRGLASINGVPQSWMRQSEELAAMRQQREEMQQMQQMAQMGPGVESAANAAKTMVEAQTLASGGEFGGV